MNYIVQKLPSEISSKETKLKKSSWRAPFLWILDKSRGKDNKDLGIKQIYPILAPATGNHYFSQLLRNNFLIFPNIFHS